MITGKKVENSTALRILGMSWGVKITCQKGPFRGVSLGGSGVSIVLGSGFLYRVMFFQNLSINNSRSNCCINSSQGDANRQTMTLVKSGGSFQNIPALMFDTNEIVTQPMANL